MCKWVSYKMKIIIYSTSICHFCKLAKDFFISENLEFEAIDVTEDENSMRYLIEQGISTVPVIKIDDDTFIYNIDTFANHKISGDYVGNKIIIDSENEQHVRNKLINVKNYKVRETYNGGLPDAFCSGECYMLSRKAAKLLISYKGSKKRTRFGIEDIFVGYILQSQKVKINQNKFINYEHPVDIEKFHKIYQTHYNPVNIKSNE